MYMTVDFVSKNVFKYKDVHNNVRKWPNLCSIGPRKHFGRLVEKLRPID